MQTTHQCSYGNDDVHHRNNLVLINCGMVETVMGDSETYSIRMHKRGCLVPMSLVSLCDGGRPNGSHHLYNLMIQGDDHELRQSACKISIEQQECLAHNGKQL